MAPPRSASTPLGGRPMLDAIFQAVSDGDFPRFKALLTILGTGTGNLKETVESLTVEDPRLPGAQGYNALHLAAIRGHRLDMCRYLVETLGVDVNCSDKEGKTPLFLSLLSADVCTTKYLLDHGANPNKTAYTQGGVCPLHQAAGSGDADIVELLLTKGAYVDPVAYNVTPLYVAAREGQDAAMKILLDHNADALYLVPDDDASANLFSNRSLNGGKALLDAEECQKKRPDWPKAYYRQGTTLMLLKEYETAGERFSHALKLDLGCAEIEGALRKASESLKASQSTSG